MSFLLLCRDVFFSASRKDVSAFCLFLQSIMRRYFICLIGMMCLVCTVLQLQAHEHEHPSFVENKGQWPDQVCYRSLFKGGAVYFERGCITYNMQNRDQVEQILGRKFGTPDGAPVNPMLDMYAYRVHFAGCQTSEVSGSGMHSEYHNYYIGNDSTHWASKVHLFDTLCYHQIYDGIDLKYYFSQSSYKYEFCVSPGSMPDQIRMWYEGADRLQLKSGNLIIRIRDFEAVELKPYAYQVLDNGERVAVDCRFVLKGKQVHFRLGKYETDRMLIIDPIMVFCSYTGSFADNWGYTATYDKHGNMYGGGSVFGQGYPVEMGAYQVLFAGGSCDIAISKFSASGDSILFSTYLGGNRNEVPHSLVVNDNDELYVLASTSSWNYPVTTGAHDTDFHWSVPPDTFLLTNVIYYWGGIDIAVSKFNADGTRLLGSTFFGGSGPDGLSTDVSLRKNYADEVRGEIMVDAYSNVYIVSSTASRDLPVSATAFQRHYGGGRQDGCVAKFSYDLKNLIWCSYLGGDSADAAYSMVLDKENNLYVCGGTRSRNLPVTSGALQPVYGGGVTDGYVAHIATNGNSIKAMTYLGKGGFDQSYLIKMDQNNAVYVMSLTDAIDSAWLYNAQWYILGGGQVISKLDAGLSRFIWSTTFGTGLRGGPDLSPTALMVDLCHQVYFSGWGSPRVNSNIGNTSCGTRGLPISGDALRRVTDNDDFYFLSLNDDASNMVYATFFGGNASDEHVDGGTSRFDRKGYIYQAICASCGGNNDLPVTPGVAAPRNNSGNCNLGVVKMDFNLREVVADFSMPNVICAPMTVVFDNTSRVISDTTTVFFWDFGDGFTETQRKPIHRYAQSGTYKVRLIVSDTASCNGSDTMERELIVLSSAFDTLPDKTICRGDFVQIGIQPANTSTVSYSWTPKQGLSSTDIANPIASDTISRTYYLMVTDGVCTDTFRIRVKVVDARLEAGPDRTLCVGDTLRLQPFSQEGKTYQWSSSPYFTDTLNTDTLSSELYLTRWKEGHYFLRMRNAYCVLNDSVQIHASQVIAELPDERAVCYGDTLCLSVHLPIADSVENYIYSWSPRNVVCSENSDSVCIFPQQDMRFSVEVRNAYGCVGRDTLQLKIDTLQLNTVVRHIRCHGEQNGEIRLQVEGGKSPFLYQWTPAVSQGSSAEKLSGGRYRVEVTDDLGCRHTVDTLLNEPEMLRISVVDAVDTVFCNKICNGRVELAVGGGVPPYRYRWETGDTVLKIKDLCAGTYRFVLEDNRLCTDTLRVHIADTSDMQLDVQLTPVRCYGFCDGSIRLLPSGQAPYQYRWNTGSTSDYVQSLCAGVYDVTVTDSRFCSRRLFPEVKQPQVLRVDSLSVQEPLCYGKSDGQIAAFACGGTPPYLYFWDGVQGTSVKQSLTSGKYRLEIRDANLCTWDTLIVLPERDSLSGHVFAGKVPCKEVCNAEAFAVISGGTPPYTYAWDDGSADSTAEDLCYGAHELVVTDRNGCKWVRAFQVEDSAVFTEEIRAWADRYELYAGEKTMLHVTKLDSDYTYQWSPSDGLSSTKGSDVEAAPEDTTIYTVLVRDRFGCQKTDTVYLRVIHVFCEPPYVFVANTFSPNGDGINDLLYVRGDWVENLYFAVFDRWGEKVFESTHQQKGWDGTYRGKPCEQGVYVYYVEVECKGQTRNLLKGNVTLIR